MEVYNNLHNLKLYPLKEVIKIWEGDLILSMKE